MRTRLIFALAILVTITGMAQNGINYKAIVKDGSGNVVTNDLIQVNFKILKGTAQTNIYEETYSQSTDDNGLIVLNIGEGTVISGDFTTTDWGSDAHFLNVQVNTGAGLVDMGTTEFKSVPYAMQAQKADNVFSGNYDDLVDTPTFTEPSGLEQITENGSTGWRLIGRDSNNHGDIGGLAVDLSSSAIASAIRGATGFSSTAMGNGTTASGGSSTAMGNGTTASGSRSTAMGFVTVASGGSSTAMGNGTTASGGSSTAMGYFTTASRDYSTAMGYRTTALGEASTAMGYITTASSFASLAIGRYNIGGGLGNGWVTTDPLFEIGIGSGSSAKANAMTVLKNGKTGIGTSFPNVKLHITGGSDANLSSGSGYLVLGNSDGINLVLDENEIIARSNGSTSRLYLQKDGGDVSVGGSVVHSSDRRLKKDITELPYGLKEVLKLQPKSYYWKNRAQEQKSLGLIVQDVQSIIGEVVTVQDDKDKTLGISYTELIPVLINTIKEQNKRIDALEARLASQLKMASVEEH